MKKYHYVYEIIYTDGKRYIGSRSCIHTPNEDSNYIGSSKHTPNNKILQKIILKTFRSRVKALRYEIFLHNKFNVHTNDMYYNKAKQTSSKFSTEGLNKTNCEWIKNRKYYSGDERTEAQKIGALQGAIKAKGQKVPSRGRSGKDSNRFKPWYYITPEGEYKEFTETPIKNFCKSNHNTPLTQHTINNGMFKYEHTKIPSGSAKGWVVGFLPKPDTDIICLPLSKGKASWWYKPPGKPKVDVHGISRGVFCDLGIIKNLTQDVIKNGVKTGKPLNKYEFKGWTFGLVTGMD